MFLWGNVFSLCTGKLQSENKILFLVLHTAVCSSRIFRNRILGKTWLLKKEVNITHKTKLKTCSSYTEEEEEPEEEEEEPEEDEEEAEEEE